MTKTPWQNLLSAIEKIGKAPEDTHRIRLQKMILIAITIMTGFAGFLWGSIYLVFNEPLASSIPLVYGLCSLFNLVAFNFTRRYRFFRFSQLLLLMLLPFLLMLALGGFVNGSAIILWAMITPLGALLLEEFQQAVRWFLAYLTLVVISGFLQSPIQSGNNLPSIVTIVFFVINIGAVSTVSFVLLYYFVAQRNAARRLLRLEKEISERLLLNVLPREIAAILKNEIRTIADHHEAVSILFADIVGFTPLSARLTPGEMVDILAEVFSYFDALVEKYDLEKIRTIGDSYMVASGVPRSRRDHAQALARLALEMNDYILNRSSEAAKHLQFRIGINSGPVVAGVVGTKKFQYDLWGDTVNIASRMESHGIPEKIHITQATYELIKDEFICNPRGRLTVKGKGEMNTWFLEATRA